MSLQEISDLECIPLLRIWRRLNENNYFTKRSIYFYRHKMTKYKINENIFEKIDTPEKAYILGFLFADGCVNSNMRQIRLKLQERDEEILKNINLYLNYNKPLNKGITKDGFKQSMIIICNKKICTDLMNHGLTPRKSFTCQFPSLDSMFLSHFIRGYFDGDGSIYVYRGRQNNKKIGEIKIMSSTVFCVKMMEVLSTRNIKCKIEHDKRIKIGVDQIRIRDNKSIKLFYYFIYYNATMFLNRKHDKFLTFLNMFL